MKIIKNRTQSKTIALNKVNKIKLAKIRQKNNYMK